MQLLRTVEVRRKALVVDEREAHLIRRIGKPVQYRRGDIIWAAEERADGVYLIESGYVKIYMMSTEGHEVTVGAIRNPGEMFGLADVLCDSRRPCFAGAITDVSLVLLSKEQFEDLLASEHGLALKVAKLLAARMRAAEENVYELVCLQASGRLAQLLLRFGERCGVNTDEGIRIKLRLTHNEIASMIGTSRQTVTLLLNTFRDERSIAVKDRDIVITDPEKLASWAM